MVAQESGGLRQGGPGDVGLSGMLLRDVERQAKDGNGALRTDGQRGRSPAGTMDDKGGVRWCRTDARRSMCKVNLRGKVDA